VKYSYLKHYIGGQWVDSEGGKRHEVINPATEEASTEITLGSKADVDKAVKAARAAFEANYGTSKEERVALLGRILAEDQKRMPDIAEAISTEMGCPISTASTAQSGSGMGHLASTIEALKCFEEEESTGKNKVVFEPIGVVALITPASAAIFAEVLDAAGVPAGMFNLVQGDGPTVGQALAEHPDVDMVSFTGSTRAGIMVAKSAADTVKRVHQELGGKSPFIVLPGTPLELALPAGAGGVLLNSGQSCVAPTRWLVHESQYDEAVAKLGEIFGAKELGDPLTEGPHIGPVVNKSQFEKINGLIQKGVDEGASVAVGGTGRPDGKDKGF